MILFRLGSTFDSAHRSLWFSGGQIGYENRRLWPAKLGH